MAGIEIPMEGANIIFKEVDQHGTVRRDETGARGQERQLELPERVRGPE